MGTVRTLLVLRHGKSAYPQGVSDVDRPLAPRGVRDAAAAGRWLRDQGLTPDLAICSIAERTRQTWDLVSNQLGWAGEDGDMVRYDPRLYMAGVPDLIGVIQETPAEVGILALVGHNPGAADLVESLTGGHQLKFPTSALAVIDVRGDWSQAAPGAGTLATYWTPKGGSVVLRD